MLCLTIALFTVSLICELVAIALIFGEARQSQKALKSWKGANPDNNANGSYGQNLVLNQIMIGLLGRPWVRYVAAILILVGLVTGAAGNFVSLAID